MPATTKSPWDRTARADAFREVIRGQSWRWLSELERKFDFLAEIVDDRGDSCGVLASGSAVSRFGAAPAESAALKSALTEAITQRRLTRASVDGNDVLCCPLSDGHKVQGALLLSRPSGRNLVGASSADAALEQLASWLVPAVDAQLRQPEDDETEFDRVSSLHKLLKEAADHGSERDVITSFAEALLAWDCVELRAYVEDVSGRRVLAIATPGLPHASDGGGGRPGLFDEAGTRLIRVPPADVARLDLKDQPRDVFIARIGGGPSQPWFFLFSGELSPRDEVRLGLYLDLVRDAVIRVAATIETRATWAILQRLMNPEGSPEQNAEAALTELSHAVEATGAALDVMGAHGIHALALGDRSLWPPSRAASDGREMAVSLPVLDTHTMRLAVRRNFGESFTRREQQLFDEAGRAFAAWLPAAIKRLPQMHDRRTESRGFEQILDRAAGQHADDGLEVVVLVIVVPPAIALGGTLQKWVVAIRGLLRASDLAGALSDREIGVLLSGTTSADLAVVRARILRSVAELEPGGTAPHVTIGVGSGRPGTQASESLVRIARRDAQRHPSERITR